MLFAQIEDFYCANSGSMIVFFRLLCINCKLKKLVVTLNYVHMRTFIISLVVFLFVTGSVNGQLSYTPSRVADTPFVQEYCETYPVGDQITGANDVRYVAVDNRLDIWIATAADVFVKKNGETEWKGVLPASDKGPAFVVLADDKTGVWMGVWNGVYRFYDGKLQKITGTDGPISVFCAAKEGIYAFGAKGIWLYDGNSFKKKNYSIARSIRDAVSDGNGGIWVASDVGLYHCSPQGVKCLQNQEVLLSAYIKGVAFDTNNRIWAGGLGGVSVLNWYERMKTLQPENGIPSVFVSCVRRSPDGSMWVGTDVGVVRYHPDGSHSLRFSRRWLLDDKVAALTFDKEGNAWVATAGGVSAIKKRTMTLAEKQDFFYDITMKRHVREPWIVGYCRLRIPGDISSWEPEDDDNDGEYTGNYLVMESCRYAVTKSDDAKIKARKAFDFLKLLKDVTGTEHFFARSIVPVAWGDNVHDRNRTYTERELADATVKEPRYKPVEVRWRKSKDGKWLWKGDTSSDEWCGHMIGYFFYYELVADKQEKKRIASHVASLVDGLIANKFNMVDIDGTHTRWAVWGPDQLNRDPEWAPDRNQNSMEMLAFLKLAAYMTGNNKYQQQYLRLINEEHYLENMAKLLDQNPAWFIYYDTMLHAYVFPILLHCEKDPKLLGFYENLMDSWMEKRKGDKNPLINFFYCYARDKKVELDASIDFLKDTPLDLVNWVVDHTKREDVHLVHAPVLDELQISELPSASERAAVRWDRNPWAAINGHPDIEREPVFWLLPYWMGRYLGMIE